MELEQRHVIKFVRLKGLKFCEIAPELSKTYGQAAHAMPSIKCRLRQFELGKTDLQMQDVSAQLPLDDVDTEVLSILQKLPFSSVPTIDDSPNISASAIDSHLVEGIEFTIFSLR
jgi:hypothetical protein